MAKLTECPTVELQVHFTLTESEARALDALAGYNDETFLDFFYKNLGRYYLQPHEAGLRSLFQSIRASIPPILKRTDDARKVFEVGK